MKKNLKLYDKIALYLNVFIIILMITCSKAGAVSVKVPLKGNSSGGKYPP